MKDLFTRENEAYHKPDNHLITCDHASAGGGYQVMVVGTA